MHFPVGKLPSDILEKLLNAYTSKDGRVVVGPAIGEDAAVIDIGNRYLIAKTDPITFVAEDIGAYTVFINANDIATMGGTPGWFLATVLLPEKHATPELAERIFSQLSYACKRIDISLCGGHTEITVGIERPIVIGMMLGEVEKEDLITTSGAKEGDDIILTKAIAVEAVSVIARQKSEELADRFGKDFVDHCKRFTEDPGISILKEASIARRSGDIHSMHDPTEGGLATGLYEIAKAAGVGIIVDEARIPVMDECKVLSDYYKLNPLGLIASGSLLITLNSADSDVVMTNLKNNGITSSIIGKIDKRGEGVKIKKGDDVKDLQRFERDEITKIL